MVIQYVVSRCMLHMHPHLWQINQLLRGVYPPGDCEVDQAKQGSSINGQLGAGVAGHEHEPEVLVVVDYPVADLHAAA